ncbi:hypothetical protein [Paraburkholderia phenazinium]|nr:hypothetical protein [Paraburkholderia phenazinium]
MRTNLWNDPRVSHLCDLTGCEEAAVIGGLYWLWATADDHSADGILPGLTAAAITRKTGVSSLGSALVEIGWIEEIEGGVRIFKFDDHNGASAKSRAQTAKRVGKHRGSAAVTQEPLQKQDEAVTSALAKEEKRREEQTIGNTHASADSSRACASPAQLSAAMRGHSIESQSGDPRIIAAAEAGVTVETVEAACGEAKSKKPGQRISAGYVVSIAEAWTREANSPRTAQARASPRTYHDERAETIAALTGRNSDHERPEHNDRIIDV